MARFPLLGRIARPGLVMVILATGSAPAARAQAAPAGLQRRMNAFAAALREVEPTAAVMGFFPRQGEWELIETPDNKVAPGAEAVVHHRIRADSTLAAITEGSPICDEFGGPAADVGPYDGTLVMRAMDSRRPWRYVGRLRFVPPGSRATGPAYVEWRREGSAWVVSRIGATYWYVPRLAGQPNEPHIARDTMEGRWLPPARRYAADLPWYRDSRPIRAGDGWPYVKYGLPREIGDSMLVRWGSIGVVPVFIEPAADHERPEVLYIPTGPGEYHPYQGFGGSICRSG